MPLEVTNYIISMVGQRTSCLSCCMAFHASECFDYIKLEKFTNLRAYSKLLLCITKVKFSLCMPPRRHSKGWRYKQRRCTYDKKRL